VSAGEEEGDKDDEEEGDEDDEEDETAISNKTTVVPGREINVMDSRAKTKGVLLSMGGYLYHYRYHTCPTINGEKTPADVYGCQFSKSGCPAKLWVGEGAANYIRESVAPHDHGADPIDIQRRVTIEKALDLMTTRPERKVREVMTEALRNQQPAVLEALDHENLRKRLSKLKTKLAGQPTGPTSPEELEIPEAYMTHDDGEPFVIYDEKFPRPVPAAPATPGAVQGPPEVDRIIIVTHPTTCKVVYIAGPSPFRSIQIIQVLAESEVCASDGTFFIRPQPKSRWRQVYSFHSYVNGTFIP
jgi:hypothetical protein